MKLLQFDDDKQIINQTHRHYQVEVMTVMQLREYDFNAIKEQNII